LSELLSKVTDTSCSFTSNVQCVSLAAGRRTRTVCSYRSHVLIVANRTMAFHKEV